ncbi:hypothetical protein DAPPUDRAFT_112251 [Daphnia pulex]|uniref:Uncharacterized protein n=1 Tax=Daphnia pulex TaxID=6669 RepID=E9HBE1_DAPPU|nr:hypothetical protein DAPPUDRAFT_112251 [Daphnia pulex]|eukprot:EFX70960.1 hypothetical protein DAPPUDRAFT_112251 [Daphnia pulex]
MHVENLNLPSCNFLHGGNEKYWIVDDPCPRSRVVILGVPIQHSQVEEENEKHSTNYEETMYLPLCAGLPKPRYSLCYSLDTETPSLLQLFQARTGSLVEIIDVKLQYSGVSVDEDSIYEIPHELGGSKAYENMRYHHLDRNSSSIISSSIFVRQIRPFPPKAPKSRHSRNLEKAVHEIENVSKQTVVAATHKIYLSTSWETSKLIAGDANVCDIIMLEGDKANTDGNGPIFIFSRDRVKTRATADENAVVKEDSTVPMTFAWNHPVARDSEETEFRAKVFQLAISWT